MKIEEMIYKKLEDKNLSIPIRDYYSSLSRLISNEPKYLPKNSKINLDNVALEAGRNRGAIKGESIDIKELKSIINSFKVNKIKPINKNEKTKSDKELNVDILLQQLASLVIKNHELIKENKMLKDIINTSNNIIKFKN
jgi:hypothetical protein